MRNLRRQFPDLGEVDILYGKTSCAPALGAVLCLFAIMFGTGRAASSPPEIALRVNPARQLGDLPRNYRPSAISRVL